MPAPWEEDVETAPWESAAPVKAVTPKKKKPVPQAKPVDNARDIARETYPGIQITDWVRDPNSPLGRANPESWHNLTRAAIDARRINGMSFEDYVEGYRKKGYSILEARDEYTNPSAHSTGPHWHTVLGGNPKPVAPVTEKAPWETDQTPVKKGPTSTPVLPKDVYPYPEDIGKTPGYGSETADIGSGNPIPEGFKISSGLDRDGRPDMYSDEGAVRHFTFWAGKNPEGKKMSDDTFLETVFKNNPHVPDNAYNRKTLLWYRSHYKSGGTSPMSFNEKNTDPVPTEDISNGASVSAPPPLDFGDIVIRSGKEMADQAGHGLNAAIIRGTMKGLMSEEDYNKEVAKIEEDRAIRERFWADQSNRTDSPVTDEIGKFAGAIGGDMNPAYLFAPIGGEAAVGRIATQAGVNAGIDVGVQNAEMYQGTREGYDPVQTATSAAMGAAFQGAVGEPLGFAIKKWQGRGGTARSFEDNPRVVEVGDTPTPSSVRANKKTVGEEISTLTKGWKNSPEFVVHSGKRSFSKVEPDLWAKLKEDGAQKAPAFYADDGRIHVIADNVKDVSRVKSIVYHEALGHSGLANKFGDDLNVVLTELYKKNWKLRQEADTLRTGTQYGEIYSADANPTARYVEEVLAKRSENGVLSKSILDKFIPMLRQYGRDMGLDLRFTDREVRAILADAHNTVVNGGTTNTGGSGLRYMYTGLRGAQEGEKAAGRGLQLPEEYWRAVDRGEAGESVAPGSQVHKDTGWFMAPDGRWRRELSDRGASLKQDYSYLNETGVAKLPQVLDHPELYRMYPELRNVEVTKKPSMFDVWQSTQGWQNGNKINITPYAKEPFKTMLHEVQHVIQELEGFSTGGNDKTSVSRMSNKHLAETGKKVSMFYEDAANKLELSAKAHLAAVDDPLFQKLEDLNRKIQKSYSVDGPWEERRPWVIEKGEVHNQLWEKYLGVKNGTKAKELDKTSYDQMWDLFIAAEKQDGGLLGVATELSQELDKIKAIKRDIDRSINSDGTLVDREHLVKTLQKNEHVPFEAYEHLFGEVEARDTANRSGLSEVGRRGTTPYTSEPNIDPTGYVFDNGMAGYGVSKSETPADIRKARHNRTQKDNTFKTEYQETPPLKDIEKMIAQEEVLSVSEISPEIREYIKAEKELHKKIYGADKPANSNTKYILPEDFGKATKQEVYESLRERFDPLPDTAYTYKGNGYKVELDAIDNPDGKGFRLDRMFKLTQPEGETTGRLSYDWQAGNWVPTLITSKDGNPLSVSEGLNKPLRVEIQRILREALPEKDVEGFHEAARKLLSNNKYILPEEKKGRAGSINLDKIVTKDGIDTTKLYKAFAEGIDKEKVTYEDAIAAVREAGVTPSRLLKKQMKVDPTMGISAAVALEKGHADVVRLQKKILTGNATAKEEGNFAYLLARQAALQQKVSNYRSDIGRALNFMKIMVNEKGPLPRDFFEKLNVADLSNREVLYKIATLMDEHSGNQAAQSKIIRDQFTPFWEDYLISYRYSMMLYGLGTHAKNFIGNASMGLLDSASHLTASGLGHLQGKKFRGTERVAMKGAALRNIAMAKALFEAQTWKDVGTAWLTGKPPHQVSKVEVGHNIFTEKLGVAGAAIDAPQKALAASDSMWRSILENGQLYELALRQADREGLKGGALWDRVAELTANPTPEMAKLADSNTATLQLIDDPSVFGKAIERMKSRPRDRSDYAQRLLRFSAHIALPFTRVTDNILRGGIRHTPGLGMLDRQNLADFKAGGARRDLALARQLVGATLIGYLVMKTDAGELTGDGPADFRLKAQMMASGWRPNSIKLADGKWHSLDGFDAVVPMSNVIAQTVSHMKDKKLSKEDAASRMINLLSETGGNLAKNTFAKQAGDLFAMVGEGPKVQAARENYLSNLSSSFMPAGLRQYAEMNDGMQRDRSADGSISGKIEAGIKGSIPGLRETLPVKHDVYGREMESERTLTGVNKESTPTVDKVIQEVERLTVVQGKGALVGPATRANIPEDIRDGATSETVQAFQKLSGKYIYEDLKDFILSKDYEEMTDEERIDEIKAIVRDARADAKDELFPDLMETPPPSPQQEEEVQPWMTGE